MTSTQLAAGALAQRLHRFPLQRVGSAAGEIEYRQAGMRVDQTTHLLLHGIGSGSASWLMQLEAANQAGAGGVLAWEAPGYGRSSPVGPERPDAGDYARRLWEWVDVLGLKQPLTLVGHSLGALMAARAAVLRPAQVSRLVLLAPAQGYAPASAEEREAKRAGRLAALQTLGVQAMAQKRGVAMLASGADAELLSYVQAVMAQLHAAGYTQAVHLLADGDLLADVRQLRCPVSVGSGRADGITPPAGCCEVAAAAGTSWTDLGEAGHACALDAPQQVNALLGLAIQPRGTPA